MKKSIIIFAVLGIILVVALVMAVVICLGLKRYFDNQTMDKDGMLNPAAVSMQVEEIQGEYERGEGPRIIIDGLRFQEKYEDHYYIDTVIEDAYINSENTDRIILCLRDSAVRYETGADATIKECYVENKVLHLVVEYSFGERDLDFEWTDQKEFYYYDIVTDEYMPKLEGTWAYEESGFVIENGTITFTFEGEPIAEAQKICVVKENQSESGRVFVADENLHVDGLGAYSRLLYQDGKLYGRMIVLDSDSSLEEFVKVK